MKYFISEERGILDNATPRQIMIAQKLATLIGSESNSLDQNIPVASLIGKNYDVFDMKRAGLLLKNLKKCLMFSGGRTGATACPSIPYLCPG